MELGSIYVLKSFVCAAHCELDNIPLPKYLYEYQYLKRMNLIYFSKILQ